MNRQTGDEGDIDYSFTDGTLKFFKGLDRNNSKAWFEKHREEYDTHVLDPARAFVTDMGERLLELSPNIIAEPKVNRSLFRLNRDTRFSCHFHLSDSSCSSRTLLLDDFA